MKRVATTPQTEPASRQKQEDVPPPIVDNNLALKSNNWVHCFCALDWGQKAPHLVWRLPAPPSDGAIHSPPNDLVLKAFEITPLASVKAVVIAMGPSLVQNLTTKSTSISDDLTKMAKGAGVLLLNASLQDKDYTGWSIFLRGVISVICKEADAKGDAVGFVLLGGESKKLKSAITGFSKKCVVEGAYPGGQYNRNKWFNTAPFPFKTLDELLVENGAAPIGWEAILDKSDPAPLDESLIEPLDEPTQMNSVDEPAGEPGVVELDD